MIWIVLLACAAAAWTDLRSRRIPNAIPLCLAAAGAVLAARGGWPELATFAAIGAAFAAIGVALVAIGTPLFALRLLGGGDVKLFAASAATLGLGELPTFALATLLCGGVLGIVVAGLHGRLRATLANVGAMAVPMISGTPVPRLDGGLKMPYAVAIFAGATIAAGIQLAHSRPLP